MESSQEIRKEILANANKLRTAVINSIIDFERKVDIVLTRYFCRDSKRMHELCELLFYTERIALEGKRQIFQHLLKVYYKPFLKENPEFISAMEYMIPLRNIVAHLEVDLYSDLAIEKRGEMLIFKKYKNGKADYREYKPEDFRTMNHYSKILMKGTDDLLAISRPPDPVATKR